ncbi:NUDIX hydrolase [Enemella evansiae]|uniref:NUDIX hydrolase n=1 Tax=Enemella evansiae TaxID=2016499 RepID=UPI000B976C40|nr:CoA pyrophosphatase [Enemella evansiae]OYO03346.1 coenzyme A pyrophosphatase [Enemella evansiae]TDO94303.1 NUDIX domain-containing protein [Enemella evansiae]
MTGTPAAPPQLARLVAALDQPDQVHGVVADRPGRGGRQAGVLALFATEPELSVVVTERAATLRSHAGQVSFPGGAMDPGDPSLEATALREAAEEIGVDPGTVEVLGRVPAVHVAVSGFDVNTVVGWWRTPHPISAVDAAEVASVHLIPVARLADPANRRVARHPSGYRGPAFVIDDLFIWGLTAGLLAGLLRLAGWEQPWSRRLEAEVPARFLRDRSRTEPRTGPDTH